MSEVTNVEQVDMAMNVLTACNKLTEAHVSGAGFLVLGTILAVFLMGFIGGWIIRGDT